MERARHRKSKSASGIEGIGQIQKQRAVPRLSTDSHSYIDGSNRDDVFMLELGQSSLGRVTGTPMKKLLAEEMSKEVESKRRSPSVIARLMGLEGLPSPRHVHRQQKRISDSCQQKNVSMNIHRNSQMYDGQSNWRSSMDQQEFKDVYEDLEASHVGNRRCSSRWSASSILTKPEMALIQQKFIEAKRLSTDEKLQDSKELDDTLEMLGSNKDLLLKFLRQPDSLLMRHSRNLQGHPDSSLGNHIAILKPSNTEKYESKAKAWKSEREILSKHHVTSHLKREDGLLLEPHSRHRAHVSHTSSRIQPEEKNEEKILPTRIVVLKPNLGKMRPGGTSILSPDLSDGYPPTFKKIKEYPCVGGSAETVSWRRKDSSHNMGFSKPTSKEARDIAREITRRMRDGCDETMDAKSAGLKGYVGDESSYDANESDSDSESEMFKLPSRKSFDDSNNWGRYPSSRLGESSVNREAKKRLSERWKMSHKYQDLEMVSKSSTLGEMLACPDREARPNDLNAMMSVSRGSNRVGSNDGAVAWDGPLGISSRDGWKDEISRNSSRSRSLPPTSGKSHRRNTYHHHNEFPEDKHLLHGAPVRCSRSRAVKGNPSHKEDYFSRSKKPIHHQQVSTDEIDSSSDTNFEIQMEANTKDVTEQQSAFQVASSEDTCKSPLVDVKMISESGAKTLSSESSESLPKQSSSVMDGGNSTACDLEDSSLQEPHDGPPKHGSPSMKCLGSELDSSESSKEADHPSPISVLEVPFTEDASSSESFERVSAELNELRMQLQLLKMESATCADLPPTLVPIEEETAQFSPTISETNYALGAEGWEISYALDVLIDSNLEESDFNIFRTKWYSPNRPLNPNLFDSLEKKYSEETNGLRSERRLLFDRINSALLEIFQDNVDLYPWIVPKLAVLDFKWQKDGVRDALEKLISQEYNMMSDRVLDMEMEWLNSKGEIDVIGSEIEKLLIDDMITEVLCN